MVRHGMLLCTFVALSVLTKIYWIGKLQTYYCKLLVWAVSQEMNEG